MKSTQPSSVAQVAQSMPSATPNLTDWHTWTALLTSLAAVATIIFHKDLSAYIPVVSIGAAGLTNVFLMITKHNYASALATAGSTLASASQVAPANVVGEISKAQAIMTAVSSIQTAASPIENAMVSTARSQTVA